MKTIKQLAKEIWYYLKDGADCVIALLTTLMLLILTIAKLVIRAVYLPPLVLTNLMKKLWTKPLFNQ